MKNWKKNSWRKYPVKHIPEYPDKKELGMVLDKMSTFPPLVFAGETRHLKDQLADVVDGKAFLLQGGDCAESFAEFNPDNIRDTFKLMLQMSLVLTYSASLPVVVLAPRDSYYKKTISNMQEVIARGAKVLLITNKSKDEVISENIWETIEVENTSDDLLPFLLTIPLQKLAYYSALKKGYDIDKPRNLAKSVTVE